MSEMIAEYLDRGFVLTETELQLNSLIEARKRALKKDPAVLKALKKEGTTVAQIDQVIDALKAALTLAEKDKKHPQGTAYIPTDPVTCGLQAGLTKIALADGNVTSNAAPTPKAAPARRNALGGRAAAPKKKRVEATAPLRLKTISRRPAPQPVRRAATGGPKKARAPFIEGEDPLYGVDGFKAKFGALFTGRRAFNKKPARIAKSAKPLTLFVFGDWGTGLPLAAEVTQRIGEQLTSLEGGRQPHVVHIGDVYYVGDKDEYTSRMVPFWPQSAVKKKDIGSWSLNGNHDMYSGGFGYFDTLLRTDFLLRWHGDENGEPSSFFLIEDEDWQIFGLDTSWNTPALWKVPGKPTFKDFGGQNGILTPEQAKWMATQRNTSKGCILLTHHQPASSRTTETQHADEAVATLKAAGVYGQIDAWIWGHEHRAVVFKPKAQRTVKRLKDAPEFCACLGHAGVPVTEKNFEAAAKVADVLWEEDRLGPDAPLYDGQRVVPFGFGRIDTQPSSFTFRIFDHTGQQRYGQLVTRGPKAAPHALAAPTRRRSAAKAPGAKPAASPRKPAAKGTKSKPKAKAPKKTAATAAAKRPKAAPKKKTTRR